jgi:pyruvate formate lyase activating enzyme
VLNGDSWVSSDESIIRLVDVVSLKKRFSEKDNRDMPQSGSVFKIMKFSTRDGPGLRTTVFLKGCPLSCLWCHNPESQAITPEFIFHKSLCVSCGTCAAHCPQNAISIEGTLPTFPDTSCVSCQTCVEACPSDAREFLGSEMSVSEVMQEIMKDRVFFEESGGGVTISGGEPLAQPAYSLEIARRCIEEEIHVCLDTSLFCSWDVLSSFVEAVDLFLVDLKTMDDDLHKLQTGVSNKLILENIRSLNSAGSKFIIRMPLISGLTDRKDDFVERLNFLKSFENLVGIELLPYHNLAETKRSALNMAAIPQKLSPPSDAKLSGLKTMIEATGMKVISTEVV